MFDNVVTLFKALFLSVITYFARESGKESERNTNAEAFSQSVIEAKRSRDSLRDPTIVKRLHDYFRR